MAKDFKLMERELTNFVTNDFPVIVAAEAEKHFKQSFDNHGFTDQVLAPWKPRDITRNPSKYSKKQIAQDAGRAILIGHGSGNHLRDSIHSGTAPGAVTIIVPKVYAQIHNEGGNAGRKLAATIPKRQFIGRSAVLDAHIKRKVDKHITKILIP